MDFDLKDCKVRLAQETDFGDLSAIARTIWDGSDYLPKVMQRWTKEPWFFVCEYQSRVIACIKLSLFPDNVLWIEGLRVHARFQGKGIGSFLNKHIYTFADELKRRNPLLAYEFCTYYKNAESIHMTEKMGFRIANRFFEYDKRGVKATLEPEIVTDYDMSLFEAYPGHIPLGWQAVHNHPDSLDFIKARAVVFRTPQSTYLLGGLSDKNVILLQPPVQNFKAEFPYFQHFYGSRKKYGIIFSTAFGADLPRLFKLGLHSWDLEDKPVPVVLVGIKN